MHVPEITISGEKILEIPGLQVTNTFFLTFLIEIFIFFFFISALGIKNSFLKKSKIFLNGFWRPFLIL